MTLGLDDAEKEMVSAPELKGRASFVFAFSGGNYVGFSIVFYF